MKKTGEITHHTQYGITSLSPETASAKDLLKLRRKHWTIENKVHWMRDNVLGEDASQARTGNLPHVMAALRSSTALAVGRFDGQTKIAETMRLFASEPKLACYRHHPLKNRKTSNNIWSNRVCKYYIALHCTDLIYVICKRR